jgi:hypothetical protein
MYRIVIYQLFVRWKYFLSESGCPGLLFINCLLDGNIFCLNQDVQDLRMYRIVIYQLFVRWKYFLSESGCPGFEDVQDGYLLIVCQMEIFFCHP